MQKDMLQEKEKMGKEIFTSTYSNVTLEVNGNKEVKSIKLPDDMSYDKDDKEMLEDIITLAINDALKKVDEETEKRFGKYGQGLSGLM